jgi:hypothetical protein
MSTSSLQAIGFLPDHGITFARELSTWGRFRAGGVPADREAGLRGIGVVARGYVRERPDGMALRVL